MRTLLAFDRGHDVAPILRELATLEVTTERIESLEDLRTAIQRGECDVIVAGWFGAAIDGEHVLDLTTELRSDLPVVVVGPPDEEVIVRAMKRGASDFVASTKLERFRSVLANALLEKPRSSRDAIPEELETQIRQAQKMEAIGRLAGGVAHDFNNVLSVILSYTGLILSDLNASDPLRDDIMEIQKAGRRAADLTRQLLMFTRQQVSEPTVVDVNEVLGSMDKMLRRIVSEDIDLSLVADTSRCRVKVDPSHVEQIVLNLVVNAKDAMPKGGKLTVETRNVDLDEHFAREHLGVKPGAYVSIVVTDTGTGIDKATQARIFEPFFTTKGRGLGTGVGLSTVFGIVQANSGSIWVYSEVGHGSSFKVYLPRTAEAVQMVGLTVPPLTLRGSETILLVEDDEQIRGVVRGILRRRGYSVLEAKHAGEALLLCERHVGDIQLLLTDVVMPQMSGPDLAKRLVKTRPQMKVLCMSGYTDDTVVRHGLLDSSVAFLQKPITPETLARKVREVLSGESTIELGNQKGESNP